VRKRERKSITEEARLAQLLINTATILSTALRNAHLEIRPERIIVLEALAKRGNPATLFDIAADTEKRRQTVACMVSRMSEAGLVRKLPYRRSKELMTVEITEKGKSLLRKIRAAEEELLQSVFSGLDTEGVIEFLRVVGKRADVETERIKLHR